MPRNRSFVLPLAAAIALAVAAPAHADEAALAAAVDQRLAGDRTGACLAVAVVEASGVSRAYRCADPAEAGRIGPDSAFEIGSVSKTMTSTLLAGLLADGRGSLDDPLSDWLPEGTPVPAFEGQPILLRHVVTHTSGLPALPARMQVANPADPYASLTVEALLASLGDVALDAAPGTRFQYSNFASMVLSYAVARRAGRDFETLVREDLFAPLGMHHAYVTRAPEGVRPATGHTPNGQAAAPWTFPVDAAGVGGVRATLDDMVRYVQANLDPASTPLAGALERAQQPVGQQPPMAMNWMIASLGERPVLVHEGGTGGFSSFVAVDRGAGRGVVILSDTAWHSLGGLGSLGLHLLDPSRPVGEPRVLATPAQALLDGLAGEYEAGNGPRIRLRTRDGRLYGQAEGQPEFELAYDSAGDFFPLVADALLKPQRKADGSWTFTWIQGGAAVAARRVDAVAAAAPALDPAALEAYAGEYVLRPGFHLTVRAREGGLHAQATGQGEFALDASGPDRFEAAAFGIELVFVRGDDGVVGALELHQGGQVLRGQRQ